MVLDPLFKVPSSTTDTLFNIFLDSRTRPYLESIKYERL